MTTHKVGVQTMKSKYFLNIAIALDQLFNAILSGSPDETLSSRAYRGAVLEKQPKKKWKVIFFCIEKLFFWEKDHCKKSYESELHRKQYPNSFQEIK